MIEKNKTFRSGYKVKIKGKIYPLIKTSTKSVHYLNRDKIEKRTSIKNVQEVIEPPPKEEQEFYNFGGHMPHVPVSCVHERVFEDGQGIRWIDNQICSNFCKVKKCDRWREYRKQTARTIK